MRKDQFRRLLASLDSLTGVQLSELTQAVNARHRAEHAAKAVEEARPMVCCLHCGSESITKNGSNRGLQRYRCKDCGRSFNAATKTPLSGLRNKELFLTQAECLAQGLSVRATAAKLGVSVSTAFRWRHRFLQEVVSQQPRQLSGLLEADETYFLESQKGSRHLTRPARRRGGKASKRGLSKEQVPVLVGRLRGQPHIADKVLPVMNGVELVEALKQVVSKDTLLCTDGNSAYLRVQRELGVPVKSVATSWHGPVLDNVYHVQSVNSYHEKLKTWIQRERRGVSTKYLPNYLAWKRVLEWFKGDIKPEHFIASALGRQIVNA